SRSRPPSAVVELLLLPHPASAIRPIRPSARPAIERRVLIKGAPFPSGTLVPTAAHFAWGDDRTVVRMLGGDSTTGGRKLGLTSQRARQPEAREEAFVAEPGDGGDPLALESQHEHGVGARGRRL